MGKDQEGHLDPPSYPHLSWRSALWSPARPAQAVLPSSWQQLECSAQGRVLPALYTTSSPSPAHFPPSWTTGLWPGSKHMWLPWPLGCLLWKTILLWEQSSWRTCGDIFAKEQVGLSDSIWSQMLCFLVCNHHLFSWSSFPQPNLALRKALPKLSRWNHKNVKDISTPL